MVSSTFTEEDKKRLYQELRKLETGQGAELTEAPRRINNILKKYGSSLAKIADNPEWLLEQDNSQDSEQYQELYDKFQEVMRANRELAEADALKSAEILDLRSKRNVYILNPWNNILVRQLKQKNRKLITSEIEARQAAADAKNEAQAALQALTK